MKWSELLDVAKFCALHPSMLIRSYPTSQKINDLISVLIENQKRVEVFDLSKYYLMLKFEGNYYFFWHTGRFHAYLSSVVASPSQDQYDKRAVKVQDQMPSRLMAIRFFKTFDSGEKSTCKAADRPLLLPAQEE